MSSATLWKSLAIVTGTFGLVLGGAGVAGAATLGSPSVHPAHATTSDDSPVPDCHSAEHAGLGMIINCKSEKHPG